MTKFMIECDTPHDFEHYFFGPQVRFAILDHLEYLRSRLKHEELSAEAYKALEDARANLISELDERTPHLLD